MKLYWFTLITLGILFNVHTRADDTEIYVSRNSDEAPNVIFVMDTSGSMGSTSYDSDGNKEGSRLEVVQEVAVDVINNTTGINIAIMRFDRKASHGGWLSSPMLSIDQEGVRGMVHDILYSYTAAGATPITETLAEAAAYLRGDPMVFSTAKNTENTDLCMTWEEQLVLVDKSGKTVKTAHTNTASAYAAIDTSVWWFKLAKNDPWLLRSKLIDFSSMTWKPWKKLEDWVKERLKKTHKIKKKDYGKGSPEWWMAADSWFYVNFRNPNTGEFKLWDDLADWEQRFLTGAYKISEATYRANTEKVLPPDPDPDPDPEPDPEPVYEKKLVCIENLNLDDAHDGSGNWISPITDACQSNHIVLFSDGSPTQDNEVNSLAKSILKELPSKDYPSHKYFSSSCSGNGGCAEELAYAYHNVDNARHLDGTQEITIHTIGGFIGGRDQERMNDIAHYGGGIAQEGANSADLRTALKKVFDNISSTSGSYSAPALTVNAYNSLEHLDQLYYSVFRPDITTAWSGNVKRYRLGSDARIKDVTGKEAIDPSTGFFAENATSFWTLAEDSPDGDTVESGGIARRLTSPANRNVVTYLGSSKTLKNASNAISLSNAKIKDKDLFDTDATDAEFEKIIRWAQGYDVKSSDSSTSRRAIEDPLHSRPVLLTYGSKTGSDGKEPDTTLFIGTNSGFLHAFNTDADNPSEEFAFIPKELLPNIEAYYEQEAKRVYGMDGQITIFHKDLDNDLVLDSGESAYLYAGMRRGGRSYYALDVSKRGNPEYMWQIDGGAGDFMELGQTWSKMVVATVTWKGKAKEVLFFGGGYDVAEDDNLSRKAHSMGNAIFMVDPENGELLWKASDDTGNLKLPDMTSGITGNIVPVDNDLDGDVDILYAADLGGRIWRIDLIEENSYSKNSYAQGGVIADLGEDDTTVNHVRFFNTPDIIYTDSGKFLNTSTDTVEIKARYQIAIGSGYRAHPLETATVDYFYIINDFDVEETIPSRYKSRKKSDFANYDGYQTASANRIKNGFYLKLEGNGEKILSNSVTLNGVVYAASYRPASGESRSGCDPDIGYARAYAIEPRYYDYPDKVNRPSVEIQELKQPGIPPDVITVITTSNAQGEGGEAVPIFGTSPPPFPDIESPPQVERAYWREY